MSKKSDLESVHLVNHSKCILAAFQNFRQDENMLDVTLVCNGMSLKAHKLVLSACSPLFKDILSENPCQHPIIIFRDFEFSDLKAIIEFIYRGELSVPRERLMSTLKVAEELHIRGLRRSEPNKENPEKYKKLYNQVCGKLSGRKKRKRQRRDSSDSEERESISISESDQNIIESDESLSGNNEVPLESQPMEVESVNVEENSTNTKNVRPVVLRVGDPVASNEEHVPKDAYEDEECEIIASVEESLSNDSLQKENVNSQTKEVEGQSSVPAPESIVAKESPQFESLDTSFEIPVPLVCLPTDEQNNFQGEQSEETTSITECSEKVLTSPHLSPKSLESQEGDEAKLQDEGKRFVCSKCDSAFTSRINFMKHKTLGHNNKEKKSAYECKHCNFTTQELDSLKSHLLLHSDKVPYKCSTCPKEFPSEEMYKIHLSLHEIDNFSLPSLSPASGQDLFSTQNTNPEKTAEFRCSICFIKFTSKLRCQIHEKSCQGKS